MKEVKQTTELTVRMGEMRVDGDGKILRTLLGSCIGLVLYDRQRKIGGLAHIVLPRSRRETDRPGKFADTAIPSLIEQMQRLAGGKSRLTARMAGGASMFSSSTAGNVGLQNTESCRQLLSDLRIPILASHCGGEKGRRLSFDTETGSVMIEIVGQESIELK